ncbi:MAG: VOC family protein [Deltaproteobacteria bacterium]|nr:VOC family protein [Deltaproteobacteria bacterium]
MKGDETRAEWLAAMLDGGPVAEAIEPLAPAVRRLRELLDRLAPDPAGVAALALSLSQKPAPATQPPALALVRLTIGVHDLEAALAFYRDGLGLSVCAATTSACDLDAGGAHLTLQRTARRPRGGDLRLEFHTDDLDRTVKALRQRGIPLDVKIDRERGRHAELRDPDGNLLLLFAR